MKLAEEGGPNPTSAPLQGRRFLNRGMAWTKGYNAWNQARNRLVVLTHSYTGRLSKQQPQFCGIEFLFSVTEQAMDGAQG